MAEAGIDELAGNACGVFPSLSWLAGAPAGDDASNAETLRVSGHLPMADGAGAPAGNDALFAELSRQQAAVAELLARIDERAGNSSNVFPSLVYSVVVTRVPRADSIRSDTAATLIGAPAAPPNIGKALAPALPMTGMHGGLHQHQQQHQHPLQHLLQQQQQQAKARQALRDAEEAHRAAAAAAVASGASWLAEVDVPKFDVVEKTLALSGAELLGGLTFDLGLEDIPDTFNDRIDWHRATTFADLRRIIPGIGGVIPKYTLFGDSVRVQPLLIKLQHNYNRLLHALTSTLAKMDGEASVKVEIEERLAAAHKELRAAASLGAAFFRKEDAYCRGCKGLRCKEKAASGGHGFCRCGLTAAD